MAEETTKKKPGRPKNEPPVKVKADTETEVAEEVTKRKVGQRGKDLQPRKKREDHIRLPDTEPGDNRHYLSHSLNIAALGSCDMKNADAVQERCMQYFELCKADDMKPSIAGLAVALDIDRRRLFEYREGLMGKNPDVQTILKKATSIINLQMEDYMQNGKINPVAGIFLMKNNMGYRDQTEVVVEPKNPMGEAQSETELKSAYLEAAGVDALPE